MKVVAAYHAMAGPPRPLQFVLLVAEPGPDESGPAFFETITPPGYEEWRSVIQGRVEGLAPAAHSINELVSAISYKQHVAVG